MTHSPDLPPDWPSHVAVRPFDDANAALVRRVAPNGRRNPVAKPRYHLVVIGGGTAGLVSAAAAAGLGARVALVERSLMGGDCLNYGCVPSKALIHGAREAAAAAGGQPESQRFGDVMARLRRVRADLAQVDSVARFQELGVDVFQGSAQFVDRDRIQVGDQLLHFRRAIIASGGRAAVPPIPGLKDTPYRTNESIFELTARPTRLIVIGGGPIGSELAQAFARLGTHVTLLNGDARLLPREDEHAAQIVAQRFAQEGVAVHNGATITNVAYRDGAFAVSFTVGNRSDSVTAGELLVATGRTPNVESLNLEAGGVAYHPRGITVNDRFRTSNPKVYAIGDVASALQFTHLADAQARLAVANALFFGLGGGRNSALVVPRCTYTSPEVAHVGMTVADAEARGISVETVRVDLSHVDRAILDDATEGFLKVHLRAGTDTILGGTLVAEHAGEMISELGLAITSKLGLQAIGRTMHPYPTQAEVFRKAADARRKRKLTPRVASFFKTWFRLFT